LLQLEFVVYVGVPNNGMQIEVNGWHCVALNIESSANIFVHLFYKRRVISPLASSTFTDLEKCSKIKQLT